MKEETRVSERGQVTIPKQVRDRLGIRPGQVLTVREERGRVVMSKAVVEDPLESVTGILDLGRSTDELLEAMRGKPDAT